MNALVRVAASRVHRTNQMSRLVEASKQGSKRSKWVVAAFAAAVVALFTLQISETALAQQSDDRPPTKAEESDADWGPESDGLLCRILAVPPSSDDESPKMTQTTEQFARDSEITFAVELKNVSDQPLTLLGVRYGESWTASGQLNTAFFAPHLFEFEFIDATGKPVLRPSRGYLASMLELSGASAHAIAPNESLVVLLRPAQFHSPMEYRLPSGTFRALVHYHGPSEKALAEIKKHWPDKPQGKAWSGKVTSNEVSFRVADQPKGPDLVYGEAKDGLQAAVEFRPRGPRAPDDPHVTFPLNTLLDVVYHLKNVSDKPVSLVSETWRQDDQLVVVNSAGEEQQVAGAWYSGFPILVRWTLKPGEIAEVHAASLAIAADQAGLEKFEHPVGKWFFAKPGKYTFRYTIRLGSIQTADEQGNAVPGKDDVQAELVTGEVSRFIRARTPEDDARERIPTFTGFIEFVSTDGQPIASGTFTARSHARRNEPAVDIHSGPIEIPNCTEQPVYIYVRAPGYEEAGFYDVQLASNDVKRIELTPAAVARFRLVSSVDGTVVAGANVRYFNKSSGKASAGPYPMNGLEGPVWATSQQDGSVVLDTLQRVDPHYSDLGDAVYYFYIESPDLAPRFLGPVKAGQDLGDVEVGPLLEVKGEIRGTAEELARFAAEWDQPFELTSDNPDAAWLYAISQQLEPQRDGDKLTFHLTGLRPGKLRIIANFGPHPHQVQHTYARRDPQGSDIVVEVDLEESISDLIVTPQGQQKAD